MATGIIISPTPPRVEPPTTTKEKPKLFPDELRKFLRKALPDPIGKMNSDVLLDILEDAILNAGGAGFEERVFADATLIGQTIPLEKSTIFILSPADFADPNNTFTIDLGDSQFFKRFAFVIQPGTTDWYFNVRAATPFLPRPEMINNVIFDTPPYVTWNIKMSSQIFTADFMVVPDTDDASRGFALISASFNPDFENAYTTAPVV